MIPHRLCPPVVGVLILVVVGLTTASELKLVSGRYIDLLVFLEEDWQLLEADHYAHRLERIKDGFRRASSVLAKLTAGVGLRRSLGSISLLVSARLARRLSSSSLTSAATVAPAEWQRRDRADFLVSGDLAMIDEGPVTAEAACGRPARQVLLAAESLEVESAEMLGRRLALYFSQYRWGLLSETPLDNLLQEGLELQPATCSPSLSAELRVQPGNRRCAFNPSSRRLTPNCSLVVTETQPGAASFLFAPYSPAVTRFCDSPGDGSGKTGIDPRLVHNAGANNLLNRQCGMLSAAEIVRLHADYKEIAEAPIETEAEDGDVEAVQFRLVAESERRSVVVVMDTSGSMSSENRLPKVIAAVNQFLVEILETGSRCALIAFNMRPTVLADFVTVDSPAVRRRLAGAVSALTANGGTCIGGAVNRALQLLGVNLIRPSKRVTGQIILLSDGQEGCRSRLDNAVSIVSATSVEVIAIRYGDSADSRMARLAEVSGGRQFFGETASSGGGLAQAGLWLSLGATTIGLDRDERTITLVTREVGPDFRRLELAVDASVGRDLVLTLSFPESPGRAGRLRLRVRAPSGKEFIYDGSGGGVFQVNVASGTVSVRIPDVDIETGRWIIDNLATNSRRRVRKRRRRSAASTGGGGLLVVTGKPSPVGSGGPPATTLSAEVIPSSVEEITAATRIGVYARLLQGYAPVLGASLFATLRSNEGRVARFNLTDFGAGADLKPNDGTYSGYVPLDSVNQARDYSVSVIATAPVSRVASAGKLTVARGNAAFNVHLLAPGRITDLQLRLNLSAQEALLSWTPMEDPSGSSGQGPVPVYVIRYAENRGLLLRNFTTCASLLTTQNASANVYHDALQVNIASTNCDRTLYISVAGVSTHGVEGPASNVVGVADLNSTRPTSAELQSLGVDLEAVQGDDDRRSSDVKKNPTMGWMAPVMAAVIAAAIACLITVTAAIWLHRRHNIRRRSRRQDAADVDAEIRMVNKS